MQRSLYSNFGNVLDISLVFNASTFAKTLKSETYVERGEYGQSITDTRRFRIIKGVGRKPPPGYDSVRGTGTPLFASLLVNTARNL